MRMRLTMTEIYFENERLDLENRYSTSNRPVFDPIFDTIFIDPATTPNVPQLGYEFNQESPKIVMGKAS